MSTRRQRAAVLAAAVAGFSFLAAPAPASAPPVGPLPKGPVTRVVAPHGTLVAIALPRQSAASGLVWRGARPVDPKILRAVWEADVGGSVVLVYKAVAPGTVRVVYALTRGETPKAYRSVTHVVRVT